MKFSRLSEPDMWSVPVMVDGEAPARKPWPDAVTPLRLAEGEKFRHAWILNCTISDSALLTAAHAHGVGVVLPGQSGMGTRLYGSVNGLRGVALDWISSGFEPAQSLLHALDSYQLVRPDFWCCGDLRLNIGSRPLIMGVINITPDSFSDGGQFFNADVAAEAAFRMVEEGADIIDVGAESTRPGSTAISVEEELHRVIPVLDRLSGHLPCPISIDSRRHQVVNEALDRGVQIINDITAMNDPEMIHIAAKSSAGIVLMHKRGQPSTMQQNPEYQDVVREVFLYLHQRAAACVEMGIDSSRLVIDPGIGFGKSIEHNLDLIDHTRVFTSMGLPVMCAVSRKSFMGSILDLPVDQRVEGTLAAVSVAVTNGASIVRVHDVMQASRSTRVAAAIHY